MDKSSAKQRERSPQNASTRERKVSKVNAHEKKLTRTIKDLEKTVESLKSISRASSASYESVRGVGSASTLRSMSRASSTSYGSVHGFGSTYTLRSDVADLLLVEQKHSLDMQKLRNDDAKRTQSDDLNIDLNKEPLKMTSTTTTGGHCEDEANVQVEAGNISTTDVQELDDNKDTFKYGLKDLSTTPNEGVAVNVASKDTLLTSDDTGFQAKVEKLVQKVKRKTERVGHYKELLKKEKEGNQHWQKLVFTWKSKTEEWLKKLEISSDTQTNEVSLVTGNLVATNMQEPESEPQFIFLEKSMQTYLEKQIKSQKEIRSRENQNKELLDSLAKMEESMKIVQNEKEKLTREIASHESKNKELLDRLSTFQDSLDGLEKERDALQEDINSQRKKMSKMFKKDIKRLKVENQYLRKTLDGLHKHIIGGEETPLKELKTPSNLTGDHSIVEVDASIKEVSQKFHEMETGWYLYSLDYSEYIDRSSHKYGLSGEIRRLQAENQYLRTALDGIHTNVIDGDETTLKELKTPKSMKNNQSIAEVEVIIKKVTHIFHEIKTEAEYAAHLLEKLNELSTYDGKQDTQVNLKEPPIEMARASSKDGHKDHKKQNDEPPMSRHVEQLQQNFASASSVLKKQMNAEQAIQERECLLSTLKCLFNHVRDLSDGKIEGDISSALDKIRSSIKKESTANQGLSYAREISSIQMEWKRDAENARKERKCLLLTLECLCNHVRDLSKGKTEGDLSATLDKIRSSITKESTANQGLSHAREISTIQMEWKRDTEHLQSILDGLHKEVEDLFKGETRTDAVFPFYQVESSISRESSLHRSVTKAREILRILFEYKREIRRLEAENKYLKQIMDDLNRHLIDGETTQQKEEKLPEDIRNDQSILELQSTAKKVTNKFYELETELDFIYKRMSQLSAMIDRDKENSGQSPSSKVTVPGREPKCSPNTTKAPSERAMRLDKDLERLSQAWKAIKEKEREAENRMRETVSLQSIIDSLHKELQDLSKNENRNDSSSPLDQVESSISKDSSIYQSLTKAREISNIQVEWKRLAEYATRLLEELSNFSHTRKESNSIVLREPPKVTSQNVDKKNLKQTEKLQEKSEESAFSEKLKRNYENACHIHSQMKEKENLRVSLEGKVGQLEVSNKRLNDIQDQNTKLKKEVAFKVRNRCKDLDHIDTVTLSELSGAKISHENPDIADLSDPNRPTKLGEKYSEIYANQWTDAFVALSKQTPEHREDDRILYLYNILVDGYNFCKGVRQTQIFSLEEIMLYPAGVRGMETRGKRQKNEVGEIFAKNLSDAAKLISNMSSENLVKAFLTNKEMKSKYREDMKLCEAYIKECIRLCWHMQVHTPPLCLDLMTHKGQPFVKDTYKEFSAKGKKIAFIVWPALFLHEKGPLIAKGVAQGI